MTHKHHKISRSRGGSNEQWNLIEVNPYDHAYGHALDFVLFDIAPQFDFRHEAWPLLPEALRAAVREETSKRMRDRFISPETRQKISEALQGRPAHNKGKRMGEEFSRKISEAKRGLPAHNKGKPMSLEQKEAISNTLTGRQMPQGTKLKISESMKGREPHNKGKKSSLEHRQKISNALKGKKRGPYKKKNND